jgi:hypothetical protein
MPKTLLTIVLLTAFITIKAQHRANGYCSKYKVVTPSNRLAIQDFRSDSVDILHTDIVLDMTNLSNQEIVGNAKLSIKSLINGITSVRFDLEGLTVDSVTGSLVQGFAQGDSDVKVALNGSMSMNDETDIEIHYSGTPMQDASGWGGFYFSGNFAWNLGVGFADDPHSYGRIWFPCFDNFIERSSFDFHVRVNNDRVASCNGLLDNIESHNDSTKTYHWELAQSIPSYLACVTVGSYVMVNSSIAASAGALPSQIFGRAQDSANIVASFTHLDEAVLKFEDAYGPYRFDKVGYSLVPFNSGAMEHATNITYPIYAANGGLSQEDLMAHELAHMWWGDNITCQTDGDMWINEGWASFSEYLFQEAVYGRESYEKSMQKDLKFMLQYGHHYEESYRAVSGQPHEYVYGDHVYKKGALVAHNLRGYLGDHKFFDAVSSLMEDFKYTSVSSDTLEKHLSIYSETDLVPFFRDWVFSGGYNVVVLDSFLYSEQAGEYDVSLFLQQKLKGRSEFHDGVPVFYTVFDESWQSESGKTFMSGSTELRVVTSTIKPHYIQLYTHYEQAQARTRDELVITNAGNLNLDNMYWDVEVESVSDSAMVVFDHIWSTPDAIKDFDHKPYTLSSYHYWKVSGLDLDNVELSGQFFYDGRSGGNTGYLDMDLVTVQEDSLVLLHRIDAYDDWEEYDAYEKNILGSSDNGFGLITMEVIKPGEYTLANLDHAALSIEQPITALEIEVYPNPSNGEINILIGEYDSGLEAFVTLYDVNGKVVLKESILDRHHRINTSSIPAAMYTYQIEIGGAKSSGKVVIQN